MNRSDRGAERRPLRDGLRALLAALALAGCGGGVDSGGTGATASFVSGPITGFGSVFVNGVHFDDTSAAVTDADGAPHSADDLRLGMTTEIRGSAITTDANGANVGVASSIVFGSELLGPLDRIDAATQLVVLGQIVDLSAATVFDDVSLSGGLASLAPGDVLEVYALLDTATGHYAATRIERKSAVTAYRLRGAVSGLDTSAKTFSIGADTISFAALSGPTPPALANGAIVRARLQTTPVAGVWALASLADGVQQPRNLDQVRIEGLINAFASNAQFSVNGVAVDASGAQPPAGLGLGVRVEVDGTASGATLVASQVKIETQSEVDGQQFELRGPITSVDAAGASFVLRGVTVSYSGATDFRNGSAASLAASVNVEARGTLSSDGTRLDAVRVTFR